MGGGVKDFGDHTQATAAYPWAVLDSKRAYAGGDFGIMYKFGSSRFEITQDTIFKFVDGKLVVNGGIQLQNDDFDFESSGYTEIVGAPIRWIKGLWDVEGKVNLRYEGEPAERFYDSSVSSLPGDLPVASGLATGFDDLIEGGDSESELPISFGIFDTSDASLYDFTFNIDTDFSWGVSDTGATDFEETNARVREEGFLLGGGNWMVASKTANDPGFAVEVNAAISDGYQPGRGNVIDFTASDLVDSSFYDVYNNNPSLSGADYDDLNANLGLISGWSREVAEIDPLILDLDDDGIELLPFNGQNILFDIDNDGHQERTGWVGADDGILVHDLNGDGRINNITETLSEYYGAAEGTGAVWASGFAALASLDSNGDGQITAEDDVWSELRIWKDANSNGHTDAGELVSLSDQGIASLVTENENDGAFISGNEVQSNSTYALANGETRTLASINFIADPNGVARQADGSGTRFDMQTGGSLYAVGSSAGEQVDLAEKGVANASGGLGDDTLIGDEQDNWLLGSKGTDTLLGGAGNDYLVADVEDLIGGQSNLQGGTGFDIIQFVGADGVIFNLQQSQTEMAIGTNAADILSVGSSWSGIIKAGQGDDVMIGGEADDVLNGEEGNDIAYGYAGNDLLRGHRGDDHLLGGAGNDILQGGLGQDTLSGNEGEDLLDGGAGDDTLDGGDGYDVAEYSGSYADYRVTHHADGSVTVADQRIEGDGTDTLYNVEALNFSDINEVGVDTDNPMPVKDSVRVSAGADGNYRIAVADLLANDLDYQGDALSLREVFGAVGGQVAIDGDEVVFTLDEGFAGIPSFSYHVEDVEGNAGLPVGVTGTDQNAEMSARVILTLDHHPEDPQFLDQWYLSEINALPVWQDYSGKGVTVGIFEPGPWDAEGYGKIDYHHPDLTPNIDTEELRTENPNIEPTQHATLVAGVIAASRNGIGGVGVAHEATLTSKGLAESDLDALRDWGSVDVANNSWGAEGQFGDGLVVDQDGNSLSDAFLLEAVGLGRDGYGSIVVFSGGNKRQAGYDTNAQELTNSHHAITVGAVNAKGDLGNLQIEADPFSNPGASILVSAPGSNVTSTSRLVSNDNGSTFGGDYDTAQGTSFAAPIVSGVIALMLEANPWLGWRDVQEILALSARKVDDPNTEWQTNGANHWNGGGMHFSRDYGFGMVDAHAAVRLAETWNKHSTSHNENTVESQHRGFDITDNSDSPDFGSALVSESVDIESVEVIVDIDHMRMGDLEVVLISPNGTRSVLLDRPGVGDNDPQGHGELQGEWRMMSTHFRGESSVGQWVLEVYDKSSGAKGSLNSWELRIHGVADTTDDTYFYTDAFDIATDNSLILKDDDGGTDTLNAAAMHDAVIIDLGKKSATISGHEVVFSDGTQIENSIGGDGDDWLIGSEGDNYIVGGRGADKLAGESGSDFLEGGMGDDEYYLGADGGG